MYNIGSSKDEPERAEPKFSNPLALPGRSTDPFNPRTEVSADAKHIAGKIVTHLWILFVLLPIFASVLLWLFGVIK
jgi:hypothetical protein